MLNLSNSDFMTREQLKKVVPSVFTMSPSNSVSEHYTHIPTVKIIDDMHLLGWDVIDAKEVKARKGQGYQKHLVVFRNQDIMINGEEGDNVYPQILLTNSHDGKNAFIFTAGLFRVICENGLVISTQQFEDVKIRHMGYDFEELQKLIHEMVERLPLTVESMNKMKQVQLEEEQALEFAKKAVNIRLEQEEDFDVDLKELLNPTRKGDESKDLWTTLNIVQEKLIHGMFYYRSGSKMRKARKIKNFQQDKKINQKLFNLALEYAN